MRLHPDTQHKLVQHTRMQSSHTHACACIGEFPLTLKCMQTCPHMHTRIHNTHAPTAHHILASWALIKGPHKGAPRCTSQNLSSLALATAATPHRVGCHARALMPRWSVRSRMGARCPKSTPVMSAPLQSASRSTAWARLAPPSRAPARIVPLSTAPVRSAPSKNTPAQERCTRGSPRRFSVVAALAAATQVDGEDGSAALRATTSNRAWRARTTSSLPFNQWSRRNARTYSQAHAQYSRGQIFLSTYVTEP